jgi:hypothetical protein
MDCHEPHPAPNEKTQPIQWTERPTGALVGANSLWPWLNCLMDDCHFGYITKFEKKNPGWVSSMVNYTGLVLKIKSLKF